MLDSQCLDEELLPDPHYPHKGWIGVDLDGTLAEAVSGSSSDAIGPAVPHMLKRVKYWVRSGRTVKIVTYRASDPGQEVAIQQWCLRHGLPALEVTDRKDRAMIALWDDCAVGVVHNRGVPILPQPMTLWQRLRMVAGRLFGRQPLMRVKEEHLRDQLGIARKASQAFLNL